MDKKIIKELRSRIRNGGLNELNIILEDYVLQMWCWGAFNDIEDMIIDKNGKITGYFYLNGQRNFSDWKSLSYKAFFRNKDKTYGPERGTQVNVW